MPLINVRWSDNTADLKKHLAEGVDQISATKASVERLVKALAGDNLIAAAHKWTAAISEMGGVSKIASADAVRAFGTITKAMEVMERQGKQVPAAMREMASELKAVVPHASALDKWMGSLGTQVLSMGAGFISAQAIIGAFGAAYRTVTAFISDSVKSYAEAESAQVKLTTALRSQGQATPAIIQQYNDLATEFQRTTVFSDDLITSMQGLLVEVGGVMPAQMNAALKASTDLAAGLGIDLESATMLVAKAAAGHTETLGRYGITVDDAALKTRGLDAVLEAINRQFGGQAASQIDTYAGSVEQVANAWDNVKEAVGKAIVTDPVVKGFLNNIAEFAKGADTNVTGMNSSLLDFARILDQVMPGLSWVVLQQEMLAKMRADAKQVPADINLPPAVSRFGPGLDVPGWQQGSEVIDKIHDAFKKFNEEVGKQTATAKFRELQAALKEIDPGGGTRIRIVALNEAVKALSSEPVFVPLTEAVKDLKSEAIPTMDQLAAAVRRGPLAAFGELADKLGALQRNGLPYFLDGIEKVGTKVEIASTKTKEFDHSLSDLAQAFAQLAQISGGASGEVVKSLGTMIGSVNLVQVASKKLNDELKELDAQGFEKGTASWQTYSASAVSALTAIFSVQQMITGYFEKKALASQIGHTAALLGQDFGVAFSRSLTEQVKNTFDVLTGQYLKLQALAGKPLSLVGTDFTAGAEAINLKAIIEEAGGLTAANIQKYTATFKGLFHAIATGQITVAQGTKVLEENWQAFAEAGTDAFGFLNRELKEIIELDRVMGTQSKAIAGYLKSQGAAAVEGSNAAILSLKKETDALEDLIEATKKVGEEWDKAKESKNAALLDKLGRELFKKTEEQNFAIKHLRSSLDDLGIVALGTFGAMVASGHSFAESLEAAAPGLDQLAKTWDLVGEKTDNAALAALLMQSTVLKNNPTLIKGVDGLAQSFAALSNLGVLNVDTFSAMQRAGMAMYTRVQGEVAKLGGSTKDALLPMQGYLHAAEEAARELNIPLDGMTQMLIKDSKEAGIWQEKKKTAIELQTAAMDTLIKKIGTLINTLLGIPDVDFDVTQHNRVDNSGVTPPGPEPPPGPGSWREGRDPGLQFVPPGSTAEYAAEGGTVTASGLQSWSMGASLTGPRGRDTIPMWLSEGETIRTPKQEAALQSGAGAGGGGPIILENRTTVVLDGQVVAENYQHRIAHDIRGAKTSLKKELGLPR